MYLPIYLSMYLSIYLSYPILSYPSIYVSIYVSMYVCMHACMSLCVCVSVCLYVCMHACMHLCTTPAHSWPKPVFRDRRALKMMQGKSQIRQSRNQWNLGTLTCKHWVFAITISAMALKLGYPASILDRFLETQSWSFFCNSTIEHGER